jgi:thiamine phosphate synthase YjbQ (UPF0047 family)
VTCFVSVEYTGDLEDWRDSEPKNAHAHILSILLSSSLSVPVHEGQLALGPWQSVIMVSPASNDLAKHNSPESIIIKILDPQVELDGPRNRTLGMHVIGTD